MPRLRVDFVNMKVGYVPRKRRKGSGAPHEVREPMKGWVHVTIKVHKGVPSLRKEA